MKIGLDHVMTFGKYKGKTVEYILYVNPQYLLWAGQEIPGFKLNNAIKIKARENADDMDDLLREYIEDIY